MWPVYRAYATGATVPSTIRRRTSFRSQNRGAEPSTCMHFLKESCRRHAETDLNSRQKPWQIGRKVGATVTPLALGRRQRPRIGHVRSFANGDIRVANQQEGVRAA